MKPYEQINGHWKTIQAVYRCYKANRFMDVIEQLTFRINEHDYNKEIESTRQFLERKYDQVVFRHLL
jgi:hypothetical protein